MEKQTIEYFDFKTRTQKHIDMPSCTKVEYLEQRNKNYMNYTAISFEKRKITYEELHERIDEYARALAKKGSRISIAKRWIKSNYCKCYWFDRNRVRYTY